MTKKLIIEPQYFPSIYWYKLLIENPDNLLIDLGTWYEKQSFRNRCLIGGVNKIEALIIPVSHKSQKNLNQETEISYETSWRRIHNHAIKSAYKSSPYFDYYENQIDEFYKNEFQYLWDWQKASIELVNKIIKIPFPELIVNFIEPNNSEYLDYRNSIHPKKGIPQGLETNEYYQVFDDKHGFRKGLSILDYIFNEGPNLNF